MKTSLLAVCLAGVALAGAPARVQSPDGKVAIDFVLQSGGYPAYRVQYSGKPVVLESRLGFLPDFRSGFQLVRTRPDSHGGQWTNPFGERKTVPDNYRGLSVDLKHQSGKLLRLVFRAYNEGAALRYSFPPQKEHRFHFDGEQTEFRFPEDTYGYEEHGTEGEYKRVKVAEIQPWCERPLTLEYASGILASLAEADNQIAAKERGTREWAQKPVEERATEYPEVTMFHRLPSYGLYCRHIRGLKLKNVEFELLEPDLRPALICDDVKNLDIDGFRCATPGDERPGMHLINTRQVFVRGCSAPPDTATFLQVEGKDTGKISVIGNDLSEAAKGVSFADGVPAGAIYEAANRPAKS
jgi:hypothetical protein